MVPGAQRGLARTTACQLCKAVEASARCDFLRSERGIRPCLNVLAYFFWSAERRVSCSTSATGHDERAGHRKQPKLEKNFFQEIRVTLGKPSV